MISILQNMTAKLGSLPKVMIVSYASSAPKSIKRARYDDQGMLEEDSRILMRSGQLNFNPLTNAVQYKVL